jgi:hypothetical protein
MGKQAKHNQTRLQRIIKDQPYCIYCGEAQASTIEHWPPISLFTLRQRPTGMEFPACEPCNRGSAKIDQVAAFISRSYPNCKTEAERKELQKILRGIKNNSPDVFNELMSFQKFNRITFGRESYLTDGALINISGPALQKSLYYFCFKMGAALHYHSTGHLLLPDQSVIVNIYTNASLNEKTANLLSELFPLPKTLVQGKKHVSEQFTYDGFYDADAKTGAYFSTFRISFGAFAWITSRVPTETPAEQIFKLGCLRNP